MRALLAILCTGLALSSPARGDDSPDSPCAFCMATAEVLAKRVENEKPRNHLDLRHRLDKEGTRYGKILDFRLSELRTFELLDGLAKDLEPYIPVELDASPSADGILWQHPDAVAGNRSSMHEEERRYRHGSLKRWCERAVEVHEDALTELLRSEGLSRGGIHDALCLRLTKACREARAEL